MTATDSNFKQRVSQTQLRDLAARCARGLQKRHASKTRAWGMPGARCTRKPRVQGWSVERHTSSHGRTGITRHPRTQWSYGLYRALPGDRAFLPPSSLRSLLLRNLTPASGRQDHTALPYATRLSPKPSAGLVPVRRNSSESGNSAIRPHTLRRRKRSHRVPDAAASIASRPASMTMANAPLWDGMANHIA
jgi:hypothetical protein